VKKNKENKDTITIKEVVLIGEVRRNVIKEENGNVKEEGDLRNLK
jgi:hypothetical protein